MARKPSVRQKNGYWYSEARGINRYFGKCSEVTHAQATAGLWKALAEGEGLEQDTGERGEEEIGFGVEPAANCESRKSKLELKPEPKLEIRNSTFAEVKAKARAFNSSHSSPVSNLVALSHLNCRVNRLQFRTGVVDLHLP